MGKLLISQSQTLSLLLVLWQTIRTCCSLPSPLVHPSWSLSRRHLFIVLPPLCHQCPADLPRTLTVFDSGDDYHSSDTNCAYPETPPKRDHLYYLHFPRRTPRSPPPSRTNRRTNGAKWSLHYSRVGKKLFWAIPTGELVKQASPTEPRFSV